MIFSHALQFCNDYYGNYPLPVFVTFWSPPSTEDQCYSISQYTAGLSKTMNIMADAGKANKLQFTSVVN